MTSFDPIDTESMQKGTIMPHRHRLLPRMVSLTLMVILLLLPLWSCVQGHEAVPTLTSKQAMTPTSTEATPPSLTTTLSPTSTPAVATSPAPALPFEQLEDLSDADKVARAFIRESFSVRGRLLPWEHFHPEGDRMALFLEKRQEITRLRRALSSRDEPFRSIALEKILEYREGGRVLYYFRSEERVDGGMSKNHYYVLLKQDGDRWKILSALSDDGGSTQLVSQSFVITVRRHVYEHRPTQAIQSLIYMNRKLLTPERLQPIVDAEKATIEKEAAAMREPFVMSEEPHDAALEAFDRTAMVNYQYRWALSQNPRWGNFSESGGDCQNYASQVIHAGVAPMDNVGEHQWYDFRNYNHTRSWAVTVAMRQYILHNVGKGPHAELHPSPNTLLPGDMVHIDWDHDGGTDHVVVVLVPGANPLVTSHTPHFFALELSDVRGAKTYIHLTGYGP